MVGVPMSLESMRGDEDEDAIREDDDYLGSIVPDPPVRAPLPIVAAQVGIKAGFGRISMERIDS